MQKLFASLTFSVLLTSPFTAESGDWVEVIADGQVAYTSIDNLNLSAFEDTHSDEMLSLNALLGRFYQLNGFTRVHVAFDLGAEMHQTFEQLDNTQLGANIGVRHKFGLGFYQPYLQFNVDYRQKDVD